jgi:hypothetical protein
VLVVVFIVFVILFLAEATRKEEQDRSRDSGKAELKKAAAAELFFALTIMQHMDSLPLGGAWGHYLKELVVRHEFRMRP